MHRVMSGELSPDDLEEQLELAAALRLIRRMEEERQEEASNEEKRETRRSILMGARDEEVMARLSQRSIDTSRLSTRSLRDLIDVTKSELSSDGDALPQQERMGAAPGRLTLVQNILANLHLDQLQAVSRMEKNGGLTALWSNKLDEGPAPTEEGRGRSTLGMFHDKLSLTTALRIAVRTHRMEWLSTFYRCDPRWQIQNFFSEVARDGEAPDVDQNLKPSLLTDLFDKASVFTVWRPTSNEAIKNMMLGKAVGKGMNVKGKSAKRGNISSYVPFIQVYEDEHKEQIQQYLIDGTTIRVFYQSKAARDEAYELISDVKMYMLFAAEDAKSILQRRGSAHREFQMAMKHLAYDETNLAVTKVDSYAMSDPPVFGLNVSERLFWESYANLQDMYRPPGGDWDIGRESSTKFMNDNLESLRKTADSDECRVVVYQMSNTHPMEPRKLLVAYEENGGVKPVVSDFDCFLLGSRGVTYKKPLPMDQLDLLKWSVKNIGEVLDERADTDCGGCWMESWFDVQKRAALLDGYYRKDPKLGNGDPKSTEIIKVAVSRLSGMGCVRHGAECFNWYTPQEIDDELLIIFDRPVSPGKPMWKKVSPKELQEILMRKIDEGYTFPLNPKWILVDTGWKRVYDNLLVSNHPNVQDSLNCWLPPESGVREEIERIHAEYPRGFRGGSGDSKYTRGGRDSMIEVRRKVKTFYKLRKCWQRLLVVLYWMRLGRQRRYMMQLNYSEK